MTEIRAGLPILAFATLPAWEAWIAQQASPCAGIWMKLSKRGAPEPTISKADAITGALCHGWIDGQIQPYDAHYWLIRFTPRTARSPWSERNRATVLALMAEGRMRPGGVAQVDAAKADGRWDAAYAPQSTAPVPPDLAQALAASPEAARLFERLDAANRYSILHRIHAAKTAKTRAGRIETFVAMLARGETIHPPKAAARKRS